MCQLCSANLIAIWLWRANLPHCRADYSASSLLGSQLVLQWIFSQKVLCPEASASMQNN